MSDLNKIISTILNKEEFVKELLEKKIDAHIIKEEWEMIEKLFILLYLQFAYDSLSDSDKAGLSFGLKKDATPTEISTFTKKMSNFLISHPESIEQKVIVKQAAEETMAQYVLHLKGE